MIDKKDKNNKNVNQKCIKCLNRDKDKNICLVYDKDCSQVECDFSKCESYLIRNELVNF